MRRCARRPSLVGSSPPKRGTRTGTHHAGRHHRFIPAQAGNTAHSPVANSFRSVHPRPSGEHMASSTSVSASAGSSPPKRGTRGVDAGSATEPPVHPRPSGEHRPMVPASSPSCGSSPPKRGTPGRCLDGRPQGRFIPAQAGNTWSTSSRSRAAEVHPRPSGEHKCARMASRHVGGSSPPKRGTLVAPHQHRQCRRFIPAQAGNTPHLQPGPTALYGSSPPKRGTRFVRVHLMRHRRFIPAQAGNTHPSHRTGRRAAVHPRPSGEHPAAAADEFKCCGSSPPKRGTRRGRTGRGPWSRFIPAQAGNTHRHGRCVVADPVHPRPSGEHLMDAWPDQRPSGSSPPKRGTQPRPRSDRSAATVHPRPSGEHEHLRVALACSGGSSPPKRGTRLDFGDELAIDRFIPAQAGNTCGSARRRRRRPVHPRPSGEHAEKARPFACQYGSSPPKRGTQGAAVLAELLGRFIPAQAGNTSSQCR